MSRLLPLLAMTGAAGQRFRCWGFEVTASSTYVEVRNAEFSLTFPTIVDETTPGDTYPAGASSEYGASYAAGKAFDDSSNRWSNATTPLPHRLWWDFGSKVRIRGASLQFPSSPYYPASLKIIGSDDAVNWTDVATPTLPGFVNSSTVETYEVQ